MRTTVEERARDASRALRAAADLQPRTATTKRTHGTRTVMFAAAVVILAVAVGSVIGFRGRSTMPVGSPGGANRIAMSEFHAAVHGAPYHVLVPTAPGLTLSHAGSERGKDSLGREVYTVDLFYRSSHGSFHVWMTERSYSTSVLGYDLATIGRPTTIAGTVWHAVTLPRPGQTQVQLTRGTSDGAVIEIDGPFDLRTMSTLAASLR